MKRWIFKMIFILFAVLVLLIGGTMIYLQQPKFGLLPEGVRLAQIQSSPNYVDGQFRNLEPIPEGISKKNLLVLWWEFLFDKNNNVVPLSSLPVIKTDLLSLDKNKNLVIWLGHSSYFMQLNGKRILIDPVFSDYASPVSFINKAFAGTNIYSDIDFPIIDYLLLTHDHWDHLDYQTIMDLKPKIKEIITPLGVGAHFEKWGFSKDNIHEGDWFDKIALENGFSIYIFPSRHFSGRLLTRNKTLWGSFVLETPNNRVFFSGDGGYGKHFKEIGEKFDGFDFVALDSGQYDNDWAYVHMVPEEALLAAKDLKARALLPSHIGKFSLAHHSWAEPFNRVTKSENEKDFRVLTPMIGEIVDIDDNAQSFSRWWESIS